MYIILFYFLFSKIKLKYLYETCVKKYHMADCYWVQCDIREGEKKLLLSHLSVYAWIMSLDPEVDKIDVSKWAQYESLDYCLILTSTDDMYQGEGRATYIENLINIIIEIYLMMPLI